MTGIWISTILTTGWILLGSWVAVFPGMLERLFGVGYGFEDSWGVSQAKFEALTLGTLAMIVDRRPGRLRGRAPVRRDIVATEGDSPEPTELPPGVASA